MKKLIMIMFGFVCILLLVFGDGQGKIIENLFGVFFLIVLGLAFWIFAKIGSKKGNDLWLILTGWLFWRSSK